VPPDMILAQVQAVVEDIGVDAVKVGMLGTATTAAAVAQALEEMPAHTPVVVDPVMVAESGAELIDAGARRVLVEDIIPRATVLTPNLPEALALTGGADASGSDEEQEERAERLVRAVLTLGPRCVVLTGGHRERAVDLFIESGAGEVRRIEGVRHPDGAAHGSGCTHSSVLTAQLARGATRLHAARTARALAAEAIEHGLRELGRGAGPVDVIGLERTGAGRVAGGGRLS
jgi:hydroxymethylpyrimidine/phosphomethylpyrimidine kinase